MKCIAKFGTAAALTLALSLFTFAQGRPQPGQRGIRPQRPQFPGMHGPGPHMGDWLRQHRLQSPAQQQQALQSDPNYRRLTPEQQQRLRQSLQNFNQLPPERQQRILNRMEVWEHLSPEERTKARGVFQDFRNLPEDRRHALNKAFRNLRDLSPEEQQKMIDSDAFHNQFSDREREMLKTMSQFGFGPGAARNQQSPNEPPQEPQEPPLD